MITAGPSQQITQEQRLQGAVWGQFVGDAAALGSHWIYELDVLQDRFPDGVAGFEAPREGHYHFGKKPGDQTHYGDGALVLLESIAKVGRFDARAFGLSYIEAFEPGVYKGYIDRSTRGTIANYRTFTADHRADKFDFQKGADDDHLGTASRLASLVARHHADPQLPALVEALTRVCQNSPRTVAYMKAHAGLILGLLNGRDPDAAVAAVEKRIVELEPETGQEVRDKCRQAVAMTGEDVVAATLAFGQACPLDQSFPSALQAFLKHHSDFERAVLQTLRAGGDNAGRAAMLGAWLGAHLGLERIPVEWRDRLTSKERIASAVHKLVPPAAARG